MKKILMGLVIAVVAVVVAVVAVLMSTDFNQYRGLIAEQVKAATGRDLVIAGNLNLNISLTPSLIVEDVTFANASWGSRPAMIKLERVEAEVQLLPLIKGDIRINRVLIIGLDVVLETDKKGRPNWLFGPGVPAIAASPAIATSKEGAPPIPTVRKLRIEKVKLTYRDGPTGSKTVVVIDSMDLAADGLDAPLHIAAAGSFNGAAYGVKGELGALTRITAGMPYPIRLEARMLGAVLGITGKIEKPLAGKGLKLDLELKIANLADTLKQAVAVAPGVKDAGPLPGVPLSLKGRLTDTPTGYALGGMALTLGGNDLAGKLAIGLAGQRPRLTADLTSRLLDLDSLLGGGESKPAVPAPASSGGKDDGRLFPADPLPLEGLRAVDVEIKFRGKLLRINKMAINDLSIDLQLAGGRLRINPFSASFSGGRIGGQIELDGRTKVARLNAKFKIDQLDYGTLLKQLSITDIASGKLDLAGTFRGRGTSVRALMAGLDGRLRLTSQNGRINSTLLNILSADIFAAASPFSQSKGDKDLRCAVIHFDIKSGQASAKALLIETGGISLLGKGGLDLAQEKIDLKFDPRSKKANLVKALIPFSVGGTFAQPSVLPDVGAVAKNIAKAAASIATGGLTSVLGIIGGATGVTGDGTDETDYCALALAGKPLVAVQKKKAVQKSAPPPQDAEKPATDIKGVVEGLGKSLRGLFGK